MFCPFCGTKIDGTMRFCPECGNDISQYLDNASEDAAGSSFEEEYRQSKRAYEDNSSGESPKEEVSGSSGKGAARRAPAGKRNASAGSASRTGSSGHSPRPEKPSGNGKAPGSRKNPNVLFAVLLVILAAAAGIGAFLFVRSRQNQTDPSPYSASASVLREDASEMPETALSGEEDSVPADPALSEDSSSGSAEPSDDPAGTSEEEVTGYAHISEKVRSLDSGNSISLVTTDVSGYPNVKIYCSVTDDAGDAVVLSSPTAGVTEKIGGGEDIERTIRSIERLEGNQGIGIDILVDKSASMSADMDRMQGILTSFIRSLDYGSGDKAEIISFDSYLMYMCTYTDNVSYLLNGISNMTPFGNTALYDAIAEGVENAGKRTGANCVIAFTDGEDNESAFSYQEAIALAQEKEIPVYLIGTASADTSVLQMIADATGGYYWNANSVSDVNEILQKIYTVQKNMYCIEYESDRDADPFASRTVSCAVADDTQGAAMSNVTFTAVRKEETAAHSSRYELVAGDVSWQEANDAAFEKGGHLATITSRDEMDELSQMAEAAGLKYIWIGGYTSVKNSTAFGHWITGEPFSYTAWYPGEPSRNDHDGTEEFYLMLWNVNNGWSWNDQRNDVLSTGLAYFVGKIGYIIEYES